MALTAFRKVHIKDEATSQLQNNVASYFNKITNNPILSGRLIEDVVMVFGTNTEVNHGLGRNIVGFLVVYKNNAVDVWADDTLQVLPAKTLVLTPSADGIISLYVF